MRWREGMEIAETAAWAEHGKRHASWFIYGRFFGPVLIAASMGAAGYLAFQGWSWMAERPAGGGVPLLMWVLLAVLFVGTVFAVKGTGKVRPFGTLVLVGFAVVAGWLLWSGALLFMLT